MPLRTCDQSTTCPPDQPLDNFSSEADDTIDYISTRYGGGPPPLLHNFIGTACGVTYVSQISQLDADLQAAAQAQACGNNPNLPVFFNTPQTCCVPCPDGTSTCYQVPGGLFIALNQASADALAHQVACDLVNRNKVCLGSISGCTCVGTPYSAILTVNEPATLTLSAGSLPPGVSISFGTNSATLLGVPTVMGQYTFQIKAQTAAGPYMIKTFTITVLQIVTTSLPPFTIGTPYSFQLLVAGGSGNYAWKITSGTLPAGITLSLSGLLSGTPTSSGVNPLQFSVIDTTCETLDQTFFPPSIALATKSTTQIATLYGWSEFPGFISTPPLKFKTIIWTGSSEQQLWLNGIQIGGARYDFGGTDQIDEFGNITGQHTKFLSVMCHGAQNRANLVGNPYPQNTNYSLAAPFLGYFGTNATQYPNLFGPTELCGSASLPYQSIGDQAANTPFSNPALDLFGLWGTPSSIGTGQVLGSAAITISNNVTAGSTDSGTTAVIINPYALPLIPPGIILEQFSSIETPIGVIPRPGDWGLNASIIFTNNFSAALTNPYTDAEALLNAQVVQGNGATAQNSPRTTGFVSQFTNVVFTLTASNLIAGVSYTVSVDLADLTAGTSTTKTYALSGSSATQTITDIIPTPLSGHFVQVRNARIAFS